MSLKYVKDTVLDDLVNITDAQYQGDPSGTPINKAHVKDNLTTYIKDAGMALQPNRSYFVSPGYSTLGNPFFENVDDAITQIESDGSGVGDKAFVGVKHGEYADALTLSHNGYVIIEGDSCLGSAINGAVEITAGIWIFKNLRFLQDITISGGTVVFLNCNQTSGKTVIEGSSNVCISYALKWGVIEISGNSNNIFINRISDIAKNVDDHSIIIAVSLLTSVYSVKHCELEGDIVEGTALTEDIGNTIRTQALFSI